MQVYTDGSCIGNPGVGGWGFVVVQDGIELTIDYGGEVNTTNNKMELIAAIKAVQYIRESSMSDVAIFSDSTYVCYGITGWINKWKTSGWRKASGKPVQSRELWEELDRLCQGQRLEWHWIQGHSGDKWNDRADELARLGAERYL